MYVDTPHVVPKLPGELEWQEVREPHAHFADPRGVGGERGYGAQIIPLVVLDTGKMIVPIVRIKRAGGLDRHTVEMNPEAPIRGIGEGDVVALPADPRMRKYVLLVRSLSEKSGWRVFEFDDLGPRGQHDILAIPDVMTLPRLEDRKDQDLLWDTYERFQEEKYRWAGMRYEKGSDKRPLGGE
ncbi:MAG: hypothetical protein LLG01_18960 [Planctomycetaceae bacterium]|nr:hypothetical protein [Planctomycetaceae bacterium]